MAELLNNHNATEATGAPPGMCGFTLLEVMVAMAILAISLTGVYRLQNQTMAMSANARFYSVAPLLAQAKLSEFERTSLFEQSNESGEFGEQFPGYRWALDTAPVPMDLLENMPYNMIRIELTVTLNDETPYVLRTYRIHEQ